MTRLTLALAQLNPVVGDLSGNAERLLAAWREARDRGADLLVGAELALTGYPPEDLVVKPYFLDRVMIALARLIEASAAGGPGIAVGLPWRADDGRLFNAAALIDGGALIGVRYKHHLPNYRVFDELRIFARGPIPEPIDFRGVRLGLMVCEDCWYQDVAAALAAAGAELLIVPNASPFEEDKPAERLTEIGKRPAETGLPVVYVNQVGGQDDLIFDGGSFVLDGAGVLSVQAPFFTEAALMVDFEKQGATWRPSPGEAAAPPDRLAAMYDAAVLGLRDYVDKNGAPGALLGLSGGIDSAMVAAMSVDALGAERVHAVMMPSPYTSQESLDDAAETARRLGIRYDVIAIEPAMAAFDKMLRPLIGDLPPDVTEENIQSRARGLTLMALSNKLGAMVVTTGNKSELAVGYATLYGDMCGAYNPLKDIYKTDVFRLAQWRNTVMPSGALGPAAGQVIPARVIAKPPSAELRPDQKDEDSLPSYDRLDDILLCLVEHDMATEDIIARGHDRETVNAVWRLLDRAEYKRFQAPPGPKVSRRAFGKERRYPMTNRFLAGLHSR